MAPRPYEPYVTAVPTMSQVWCILYCVEIVVFAMSVMAQLHLYGWPIIHGLAASHLSAIFLIYM